MPLQHYTRDQHSAERRPATTHAKGRRLVAGYASVEFMSSRHVDSGVQDPRGSSLASVYPKNLWCRPWFLQGPPQGLIHDGTDHLSETPINATRKARNACIAGVHAVSTRRQHKPQYHRLGNRERQARSALTLIYDGTHQLRDTIIAQVLLAL